MKKALSTGVLLVCTLTCSCGGPPIFGKQTQRITSPDGVIDAIVYESKSWVGQGPTTLVYVARKGGRGDQLIFQANRLGNFSLKWGKDQSTRPNWVVDRLLKISFQQAYITQFWSHSYLGELRSRRYFVSAKLDLLDDSTLDWGPGDAPSNGS